jgi:hypothetical protein
MAAPSPVACVLGALTPDQQRRERQLLDLARSSVTGSAATATGYRLDFADGQALLAALGELIALERRCCPFLAFELRSEAELGEVSLHISGRPGVREFVAETFLPRRGLSGDSKG